MWSRSLSRAARALVHRTVSLGSLVLLFGTASRHAEAAVVAIVPSSYVAGTGGGADPNADLSLPNANVASGSYGWFLNFPRASTSGEDLFLNALNQFVLEGSTATGLLGDVGGSDQNFFWFAITDNTAPASPRRLTVGETVDFWLFPNQPRSTLSSSFYIQDAYTAPDWGSGSYMGFAFTQNSGAELYLGYLEVTWDSSTKSFQVLSGAYETTSGVAITIVPEPGSHVLLAMASAAIWIMGTTLRRRPPGLRSPND